MAKTKPAAVTRLRGVWVGVSDLDRSVEFYELLGAYFDEKQPDEGIRIATLAGTRLSLELSPSNPHADGYIPLYDVTDADGLHEELKDAGYSIAFPPTNEQWGRRFNVCDPDGHSIALIGPLR